MAGRWDDFVQHHNVVTEPWPHDPRYEGVIEHDGQCGVPSLQALASDLVGELTPRIDHGASVASHDDACMSTPPLSPSTTISSLPTADSEQSDAQSSDEPMDAGGPSRDRDEIRRGKQPAPISHEENVSDVQVAIEDLDWYGMEYAIDQSRVDYPGYFGVWPPTAGESSTSDAAFVAMYDGHIYPEDVAYWYAHWCKWHRALAREEKRRRDRAASDTKRMRAYNHATYVQWERSQHKKRMAQAPAHAVGSKPMSSPRYRSSTCLF